MAVRGHHWRGAFGGFFFGVALTTMLTLYSVLMFGSPWGPAIVLGATVLGLLWSYVAPAPKARPAPATPEAPLAEGPTPPVA